MSEKFREVLTIKEAAKILKLSEHTIRTLIRSGELGSFKIRGSYRIYADTLKNYNK